MFVPEEPTQRRKKFRFFAWNKDIAAYKLYKVKYKKNISYKCKFSVSATLDIDIEINDNEQKKIY